MYGHKSLPSRVYSYGANPAIKNLDLVNEQMFSAHRYRNSLVEVEQGRREKVDAALRKLSPKLATIERAIAKAEAKLEAQRDEVKADHVALMTKRGNDPKKVAKISVIKKELKKLYADRKKIRTTLFASKKWKAEQKEIDAWALEKDHAYREESGLYWGTYLHVDQSMGGRRGGAPPKFMRWNGDGHLAIQIQKGMTGEEVLSGMDPRLGIKLGRVEVDGSRTAQTGIKRKLGDALCYFRVGSDDSKKPVFAEIPFYMHRPFPEGAMIKWVHLVRRRISTKEEWRLQFVLSQEVWTKEDRATDGAVALDLGWRLTDDRSLRVATFTATDGESGELEIPADWLGEMKRTQDIRSIRDQNFNDAKKSLESWLAESKKNHWLRVETASLAQWHSQGRLAGLVIQWRDKRLKGDLEIFEILEQWRQRDKHLYEFEANLRDQLMGRRESIYRNFAAQLRRKYKTAKLKKMDLRTFHELPNPEEQPKDAAMKEHARDACLSLLVRCIKESMAETIEVDPKNTTKIHHGCGSIQEFDHSNRIHTCTVCRETYDQDENAAKNLLGVELLTV